MTGSFIVMNMCMCLMTRLPFAVSSDTLRNFRCHGLGIGREGRAA